MTSKLNYLAAQEHVAELRRSAEGHRLVRAAGSLAPASDIRLLTRVIALLRRAPRWTVRTRGCPEDGAALQAKSPGR
jgi:hypothetical protein